MNKILEEIRTSGYAVVESVLSDAFLQTTRDAMYRAQEQILRYVGQERLLGQGSWACFD